MADKPHDSERSSGGNTGAYLLDQFEEFFGEVVRLRHQAQQSPVPLPGQSDPERLPIGLIASEALDRLQTLLEMQALESGRRGGDFGLLYYKDAQYVMAVLADEIFIVLDWPGRESWKSDLLETRLFGSYNAGDQFFQRLDGLLAQGERAQPELALVYLMALGLGFKGRYRGLAQASKLEEYRRRLYEYVYRKRPDLTDPGRVLSPQAYRHTLADATPRLLPNPARWLWLLGFAFAVFLVVSHIVWTSYTADLQRLLDMAG